MNFKKLERYCTFDDTVHQSQEETERENIPLNRKKQERLFDSVIETFSSTQP